MTPLRKQLFGTTMIVRDPVTIGVALGASATTGVVIGGTLVASYAAIVGYIATTLVTSWAMSALAPKPDFSTSGTSGLLVNGRDPAAPHDFVYGQARKGGAITYYESTGTNNKFLHQVLVLAGHEVEEIGDIYINDEVVTLDVDGFVTGDKWKSKIRINKHLGDQTTADADLLAESNQITGSFVGNGIAYLYIRFEYDQEVFANGLPLITAVVKGKKVYDPRSDTTAYSANAALCVRDYLTAAYGLKSTDIDDTAFSVAANVCDEAVALDGGGTEPRYTMNGVLTANTKHSDILSRMMTACAGTLFWGGGKWQLVAADYTAPTKVLTLDDLRSGINLDTRTNLRDQFNAVQGVFNNAEARWITADYPPFKSAAFVAEDGGEETTLDLELPLTTSAATAQRIAKLTLFRGREQMTLTADFGMNALDVEVGEIIALTIDRYGWDEKEFEVVGWKFGPNQDAGDLRVTLTLRETSEAAFDWNAEEKAIISNNSNLPSALDAPEVGLSLDSELRVANEQVVGALIMNVTSSSPFVSRFEVQFRKSGDTEWTVAGQASGNRFEAIGVSDGFFDVRARAITNLGVRGDFNTITDFYASLFGPAPESVTNFAANVVGNTLHLSWEPVSDLDLSHYKVRYSPETSGASYQNAIDVLKKISRPANSITMPAKVGTYFIKAVDKLGTPSESSSSIVVLTNTADVESLNVVETQVEHPSFLGSRTKVARVAAEGGGFYITLDAGELSGVYEFEDYVDLGHKYISRVQSEVRISLIDYVNDFDSATGLFDAREGDFDGDPSQFDTISARTQVSFTDDDPSGTPAWSDWQDFFVTDISARALRFRAVLESISTANAPKIDQLSVEVDMPDRVESEDDITYTGSHVVTFPSAFNAPPSIGIAASLADGDRYVISGKSRTGFTITTYTGASVSTNAVTFDYVAKGYGKELSA